MEQAGIEGKTIHDLRRTFAQRVRRSGAEASLVASLLGQKTTQMAEVYSWAEVEQLRSALKKAGGKEKPENGSIEEATGTEDS